MIRSLSIAFVALLLISASPRPETWSAADLAVLRTLWIETLGPPPPDPSNRVADDPRAAVLGQALFSDRRLSANRRVACASCHDPAHGFTDARPVGRGIARGARRTMPIEPAVYSAWQFWDGRADSLWAQALGPVENPVEHGFTRTEVVRLLAARYRDPYEALFGPLPDTSDTSRFPLRASPLGDPGTRASWAAMAPDDQMAINRAFANFGKTIAAYERTLRVRGGRFDDYLAGLLGAPGRHAAFSADEVAGLRLFIGRGRCLQCHNGPLLTNGGFANTGVPAARGFASDVGRAAGVRTALADPFNCRGFFSDVPDAGCDELDYAVVSDPAQQGAFKVPSLRGVSRRAPYMHAGQMTDLEQVIAHYSRAPAAAEGTSEVQPLHLDARERRQLIAFLRTLDETPVATSPPTR